MCAYNRTVAKVDRFLENEAKGTKIVGAHSIEEMMSKLKKPRRIMMLVKAGSAVDDFIEKLVRSCVWKQYFHTPCLLQLSIDCVLLA